MIIMIERERGERIEERVTSTLMLFFRVRLRHLANTKDCYTTAAWFGVGAALDLTLTHAARRVYCLVFQSLVLEVIHVHIVFK